MLYGIMSYCAKLTGEDLSRYLNKSPLPLTDPREAVPQAHRVVHRYGRSV